MAPLLGYNDAMRVSDLERGVRAPSGGVVRLLAAYISGYRPDDWPDD
jgi:hypothetical protein